MSTDPGSSVAYDELQIQLRELKDRNRLRSLRERAGIDFTSNDYLGLAESGELRNAAAEAVARGVPVGAGGSRLLRGNHAEHHALESEAAGYFGAEAALYFAAGYTARRFSIPAPLPPTRSPAPRRSPIFRSGRANR
jgi:8-amino-7-oxononanoate synthase